MKKLVLGTVALLFATLSNAQELPVNEETGKITFMEVKETGDVKASEALIDEAIATFDDLIAKVNDRKVEDKKAHFKAINQELEAKGRALIEKINKLA